MYFGHYGNVLCYDTLPSSLIASEIKNKKKNPTPPPKLSDERS